MEGQGVFAIISDAAPSPSYDSLPRSGNVGTGIVSPVAPFPLPLQ
jgi:hypothetical protein